MHDLPRSAPSAQGVDPRGIDALLDALEALPGVDPHGIVIVRHGHVVADGWWAPYSRDRIQLLYSMSKTFLSTAVGFAVAEGLFGLDDLVADHFPEFRDELPAASRAIRIRDALAMATGHDGEMLQAALDTDFAEPLRGFLLQAPEHTPGTWFAYNQPATYAVAAILQRRAGCDLVTYLRPRLFDPLGIGPVSWQEYPAGRALGFSGLHATTEAMAKLGQLHLDDGMWEGERLLPEGWAEQVRTKHIGTDREGSPDWVLGYGFQVWLSRHGYRGDGAYGQFTLILPEHDAVVAITEAADDAQAVLAAVWSHLLPAFDRTPDGDVAEAEAALAGRLGRLGVPAGSGSSLPEGDVPDGWHGDRLSASLIAGGVRLSDGTFVLDLPLGDDWTVVDADPAQPPVAVSGGWRGDRAAIELLFLESPHRLAFELHPDGRLTWSWGTVPLDFVLGFPVLAQAAPRPLR